MKNIEKINNVEMLHCNISTKRKSAFTLVELIIVITILAILATIGFMSFQSYTTDARDANRITSLKVLGDGLNIYQIKNTRLPEPDEKITISLSWTTISYQWLAWTTVLSALKASDTKDPSDETYYTYMIDKDKNDFQLLAMLENNPNITALSPDSMESGLGEQVYARDYTNRYIKTFWNSLWILLNPTTNAPIRENTELFTWTWANTEYKAVITDKVTKIGSWITLWWPLQMLSLKWWSFARPSTCEEGYIPVPGNADFLQPGFCVAKYEMSYDDATTPDSCNTMYPNVCTGNYDWNTVRYNPTKTNLVSQAGFYPIANITQSWAIESCKLAWWHLITNNEWMTISRNIEQQWQNWSGWVVWTNNLYNWVSNSTMWCLASSDWPDTDATITTDDIYTWLTRDWATKTGEWFWDTDCDNKRKHTLSNWQEIYDLAWNVWEHINKANTIDWTNYATIANKDMPYLSWYWSSGWWDINWWNWSIEWARNLYWPSATNYWTGQWVWNIYKRDADTDNIFIRGAGATDASTAGVFTLSLHWSSSDSRRNVGFRCAK
jgi:prepilin-type N-terminal cleavage/methylation domain-containing protein